MRTTDIGAPRAPALRAEPRFLRLLVIVNGAVPLLLLGLDALRHQLGANAVNFAIHTTGTLGLVFLLLSLSITPLRKLSGWNVVIAPRRALGLYAFFYLCLHFAIFFGFDRAASVSSTVHEIVERRYLQIGTLALVLLIPLAVTSTDAMLQRLGPKRWKALHRLSYLATALGALHYYLLVKADVRKPLAFASMLALLLGYRVVQGQLERRSRKAKSTRLTTKATRRPRFWTGELSVLRISDETPDVRTFRLGLASGAPLPFEFEPGQYLNVALSIEGARVDRSYTIASSPTLSQYCELTVKKTALGHASAHLHRAIREGDALKISAPAGRFVFTGAGADAVVLIGAGVGITPLMSMVRYLTDCSWPGRIDLVLAMRKQADIVFRGELSRLAARFPNLHLTVTLTGEEADSAWTGSRGRISAPLLRDAVPEIAKRQIFLCGPESMMAETNALLMTLGVSEPRVKTEAFVASAVATPDANAPDDASGLQFTGDAAVASASAAAGSSHATGNGVATVRFERSLKVLDLAADKTILECAEDAGIDIPFECRSGICGQCKTKLLAGRVTMDVEDALSPADRSHGLILACQAHAANDVTVDA